MSGTRLGRSVAAARARAVSAGVAASGILAAGDCAVLARAVLARPILAGAAGGAVIGQVEAGTESGVAQFLAELGQDPPDRNTAHVAGSEEFNPDSRSVDVRPDCERAEILGTDLEGHDVLAMGCTDQSEQRLGQLRLEG